VKRNAKEGKITVLYSYDKQGENIYLIAMIAIKEVLIEVNKGKNFLKNLHVRHAEEFPQHVAQVDVVHLVFEEHVVGATHLGPGEESQLRQRRQAEERGAEATIVLDWLQHMAVLEDGEEVEAFSTRVDDV
jgi:hypothetical protein